MTPERRVAGRQGGPGDNAARRAWLPVDPDTDPAAGPVGPSGHRRRPLAVRRQHPLVLLAVAAGGFLGALARYELELTWPTAPGHFPAATFVINTSGALLLGLVLPVCVERDRVDAHGWRFLRLFFCIGALGAWTTMSTLAVEADSLVRAGHAPVAVGYLAATMAAGLLAAATGMAAGRLHRRSGPVR